MTAIVREDLTIYFMSWDIGHGQSSLTVGSRQTARMELMDMEERKVGEPESLHTFFKH